MRRTCQNINRNRNVFNHFRNNKIRNNVVTPDIHANGFWIQDDESSGVKIVELNSSSDSSKESPIKNGGDFDYAHSYPNNSAFVEEGNYYRINEKARNRRRRRIDEDYTPSYTNDYYYDCNIQADSNPFYRTYDSELNTAPTNHHMNCFTIINNQNLHSDSSSENENFEAIEIIEVDDDTEINQCWDHVYNDEVVTYDLNNQPEKRTIWIYSYKNKRLLSEDDYELVNIPSKDTSSTSTSWSISDDETKTDKGTNVRIGSPIPATFIPRLDLSLVQTLSTVTEISEQNKTFSNESLGEKLPIKPRNNWLSERYDQIKQKENRNVVNWMALSPREKRRRSINTTSRAIDINEVDITYAEGVKQYEQSSIKSNKTTPLTVKVQAEVYENKKDVSCSTRTENVPKPKEPITITDTIPLKISSDGDTDLDSGDVEYELDDIKKPRIKITNSKINKKSVITSPIEKLDSNNWITEETIEEEVTTHDYDVENDFLEKKYSPENIEHEQVSNKLWMKNLQLMKPSQWTEYLPLTCSPQTLHLSISLSSIDRKKSWFKRLTRCISACCK